MKNLLLLNRSLSKNFLIAFLFIFGFFFNSYGYAGPADSFKKQEERDQKISQCTWENAQYEDPMFTEKKLLNMNAYTHGYVYSYRYCVLPVGIIKLGRTLAGMYQPLGSSLRRYDIGTVFLNKPYKAKDEGKWMVNEWRKEGDELIKYECPGDSYKNSYECVGKSKRSVMGVVLTPDYQELGFNKISENNYDGAIKDLNKYLNKLTGINSQDSNAYYLRGYAKSKLGNYKEAIADQNKAIELAPHDARLYTERGFAKYQLGDYKLAIVDFNKAIERKPGYANNYEYSGNANSYLGNYKEAIADYNKAIEINPQFANAYSNRGYAKSKLGNYKGSIIDYSKAIEINPEHSDAYNNRCESKYSLGKFKSALLDCNKALLINSSNSAAYHSRGSVKYALGDKQGACVDYKRAIGDKEAEKYLSSKEGEWCRNMTN